MQVTAEGLVWISRRGSWMRKSVTAEGPQLGPLSTYRVGTWVLGQSRRSWRRLFDRYLRVTLDPNACGGGNWRLQAC